MVYFSTPDSFLFFFFQAEDGIRDLTVTGVQTCALPILRGEQHRAVQHAVEAEIVDVRAIAERELEIGRASCRERVQISVVAVSLKKKEGNLIDNKDVQ